MTTDDKVPTPEAARLWGCSRKRFLEQMAESGVEPEVRHRPHPHGGSSRIYYWHPAEVLRARAEHKLQQSERRVEFWRNRPKPGTKSYRRARTLARSTRQDTERLKTLHRLAARNGVTVEKLPIDPEVLAWYRSLPQSKRSV